MHSPCAVIPVYNHETAITTVVDALIISATHRKDARIELLNKALY